MTYIISEKCISCIELCSSFELNLKSIVFTEIFPLSHEHSWPRLHHARPDQLCQRFTLMTFQSVSSGMFTRLIISCKTHKDTNKESIVLICDHECYQHILFISGYSWADVCTFVAEPQVN